MPFLWDIQFPASFTVINGVAGCLCSHAPLCLLGHLLGGLGPQGKQLRTGLGNGLWLSDLTVLTVVFAEAS